MDLRPIGWLATAVATLGCATAATHGGDAGVEPAVRLRERVVRYDVEGATVDEIRRSLDRGGPVTDAGRFRGMTRWDVSWRYRYAPRGGTCAVTDADVRLAVTTTLPRWTRPPPARPALEGRWATYLAALGRHEAGHRDLAVQAADEVLRTLRGLWTASCAYLREEADARARGIVERYRQRNRDYDRETRHGRAEGATWPPDDPAGAAP